VIVRNLSAEAVYYVLSSVMTLANATMFTVLAVYYVTSVSMNPLQLVLVGTVLEATIFVFEVPTGVVADSFSRRLSVIIGMFVLGAAWLLEGSIPLFIAILMAEVIRGVGETFLSGALDAWVAGEVGEANVGRVYVRSGQIRRVVSIVAMFLSVGLASVQLNLPVILGGVLYLALGVFLFLCMPERGFQPTRREQRQTWHTMSHTFWNGARAVKQSPVLFALLGVGVVAGAASEGYDRLWEAHLLLNFAFPALGALNPVVWFGIINASASVMGLITTEIFRRRLELVSQSPGPVARLLLVLNALLIISIVIFALAGDFALALVALLAKATLGSVAGPLYSAWLVQITPAQVRATVFSMVNQAGAFGQVVGGPGIGALGNFSLRAALVSAGLMLTPALWLYARTIRKSAEIPDAAVASEGTEV
jgi:DHA3 family tetracycline resistance protein-like MFS transporter